MSAESIDETVIDITIELPERFSQYLQGGYWLKPIGSYCLILPESFFKSSNRRFYNKAFKAYESFLKPILHVQISVNRVMKKDYDSDKNGIRPITYFSVIAEVSKRLTLVFLVTDPLSEENFQTQIEGIKSFIQNYIKNTTKYSRQIRRLHKIDKKTTFLLWNEMLGTWELVNVLFFVGREKMLRYKKGLDNRFAKPLMIVNETNLAREFTFPANWTISGRSRHYTMNKPNDIAMYQSIANKALKRAEDRFNEIHKERITELILPKNQASKFLDYFEEIIQAVIMAYTTIECMANSCIPFHHKHIVQEKGITKIYNKESIELSFPLRDKLKSVIPLIIDSPTPVNEKWWQGFIRLEDLRDEIIHTKESKAEIRYSTLINDRIFKIAAVHNDIVTYYARLLCDARSQIINDFPIGVGCDELIPALMTDKNFKEEYKALFNVSD
jgi:hypothetical protein